MKRTWFPVATKVIPNGTLGESIVKRGWVERFIIAAALGLLALIVQRAFYISAKVDVLDERSLKTEQQRNDTDRDLRTLEHRFDEQNRQDAARYLTREEYYHDMGPEVRPQR